MRAVETDNEGVGGVGNVGCLFVGEGGGRLAPRDKADADTDICNGVGFAGLCEREDAEEPEAAVPEFWRDSVLALSRLEELGDRSRPAVDRADGVGR